MENRMDFPLGGNAEAERCSQNNFFNFKRASSPHLKFLGSIHVKISGL